MRPIRTVVVTGLSGAGKTTAVHALEDLGFYCVDNMPLPLVERFVELCAASGEIEKAALVADSRGGEFLKAYPAAAARLRAAGHELRVLYLDAGDDVLVRRFSETRRKHPLGGDDLRRGLARERDLLRPLREEADVVIDTSGLNVHDLKRAVQDAFGRSMTDATLALSLVSFGYKYGIPPEADLVFDVRLLRNPYFVDELKALPGTDERVAAHVLGDPDCPALLERIDALLEFALPRYQHEGKVYLTVAVGCTGGRHRSVVVAERLARVLEPRYKISVRHRDLTRG